MAQPVLFCRRGQSQKSDPYHRTRAGRDRGEPRAGSGRPAGGGDYPKAQRAHPYRRERRTGDGHGPELAVKGKIVEVVERVENGSADKFLAGQGGKMSEGQSARLCGCDQGAE